MALAKDERNAQHRQHEADDSEKMDPQRPQIHGGETKPYLRERVNASLARFCLSICAFVLSQGSVPEIEASGLAQAGVPLVRRIAPLGEPNVDSGAIF